MHLYLVSGVRNAWGCRLRCIVLVIEQGRLYFPLLLFFSSISRGGSGIGSNRVGEGFTNYIYPFLAIYWRRVKRRAGKRWSTANAPQILFCPFWKLPQWLQLTVLTKERFWKGYSAACPFRGEPSGGHTELPAASTGTLAARLRVAECLRSAARKVADRYNTSTCHSVCGHNHRHQIFWEWRKQCESAFLSHRCLKNRKYCFVGRFPGVVLLSLW